MIILTAFRRFGRWLWSGIRWVFAETERWVTLLILVLAVSLFLALWRGERLQDEVETLRPRVDTLQALSERQTKTIQTATKKIDINREAEQKNSLTDSLTAARLDSIALLSGIDSLLSVNAKNRKGTR